MSSGQEFVREVIEQMQRVANKPPPPVTRADRWIGVPFCLIFAAWIVWSLWEMFKRGSFSTDKYGTVIASENPVFFGMWAFCGVLLVVIFLAAAVRFIRGNRGR